MDFREATSPEGLIVRAASRRNPYRYLLSDHELDELLVQLGLRRASSIWLNHTSIERPGARGIYGRPCMGFVLMDPTVDVRVPSADAVLGAITVGNEGSAFLPNAAAKAAGHRRLGRNYGEAVLVDPHLCGDGNFRYGHSACVRGQIVGSSSQTTDQDLYEAAALATDFVDAINARHDAWVQRQGPGEWLSEDGAPADEYRDMVSWFVRA